MSTKIHLFEELTPFVTEQNRWKKTMQCIIKINKYFENQNINFRYSIQKEPSIDYLLSIADNIGKYMKDQNVQFVHGKGKRKRDIQKLYDELKENAVKLW